MSQEFKDALLIILAAIVLITHFSFVLMLFVIPLVFLACMFKYGIIPAFIILLILLIVK